MKRGIIYVMASHEGVAEFCSWLDEEIHKAKANLDESWQGDGAAWYEARLDALTETKNRLSFLYETQG